MKNLLTIVLTSVGLLSQAALIGARQGFLGKVEEPVQEEHWCLLVGTSANEGIVRIGQYGDITTSRPYSYSTMKWTDACTDGNCMIMVGNYSSSYGRIARSTDRGKTWSTIGSTTLYRRGWVGTAYGNGTFCAIASNGYLSKSTDGGTTWSQGSVARPVSSGTVTGGTLTYGNGIWSMNARTSNRNSTSVDGPWTTVTFGGQGIRQYHAFFLDGMFFNCAYKTADFQTIESWTSNSTITQGGWVDENGDVILVVLDTTLGSTRILKSSNHMQTYSLVYDFGAVISLWAERSPNPGKIVYVTNGNTTTSEPFQVIEQNISDGSDQKVLYTSTTSASSSTSYCIRLFEW